MRPAWLLAAGGIGLVTCVAGAVLDWPAFAQAWLAAVLTLGLLPLGALPALMTFGLTGGGWGELGAPGWRLLLAVLPLFALAMLPLTFALPELFSWTRPAAELPEVVRRKLLYLNEPFLLLRLGLYLAVWLGLGLAFARRGSPGAGACAAGLLLWLFSVTFFGFDWFLSLEPTFYTDVFGLWLGVTAVAAAGAAVLLLTLPATDAAAVARRADLANLWLAILLGWAFLAFAQYIIVWSGNLPHEIAWYLHRGEGPWRVVAWVQFGLLFALPFAILLSGRAKRHRGALTVAAVSVLAGSVLQVQWWVLPAFPEPSVHLYWLAPTALAALALLAAGLVASAERGWA